MLSLNRRISYVYYVGQLEDWGKLIGDVPSATAILDRFLHHAEIINITGKSFRLRNKAAGKSARRGKPSGT